MCLKQQLFLKKRILHTTRTKNVLSKVKIEKKIMPFTHVISNVSDICWRCGIFSLLQQLLYVGFETI